MPLFNLSNVSKPKTLDYDVAIIGAGPGGLATAVYAGRARLKTIVFEKATEGGQILLTDTVEDYPGFTSISGNDLAENFLNHAKAFGASFADEEIVEVDFKSDPKRIKSDLGNEYTAKVVVIATGSNPKRLGVPGESEFMNKGVSYCAVCDGSFFKDKKVVVVGGGDSAIEEGLYLTKITNDVTLIHRRDKLRAQKIAQDRAFKSKMKFIWNTEVTEIGGSKNVEYVNVKDLKSGEVKKVPTEGVFIYVGLSPNTEIFKGSIEMDENGFIITNSKMETNIKGVYTVGDVRNTPLRQIVTAASDGAIAVIDMVKYFE
uniref:Thioredoxin reductase n=1 Tax=Mesoaciditoga lauensis TaxID=1495039 RepID=A0A7V3RDC7_9BACT